VTFVCVAMTQERNGKKNGKKISTTSQSSGRKGGGDSKLIQLMDAEGFRSSSLLFAFTLIIVLGTVLLVISSIFLGSFRLQLLTMASANFLVSPVLMTASSFLSLLFAVLGLILVLRKVHQLHMSLAALAGTVFLLHLLAVVFAFLLRENIEHDLNKVNVAAQLSTASKDNGTMEVWDALQIRYKCCGGRGNSGFNEWEAHLDGTFPDSCCTVKYPGCGKQAHRTLESDFTQTVYERLHVKGCITAVKQSLEEYVVPLLLAWALLGIVVLVGLLIVILLCIFFQVQEKRREARGTRLQLDTSATAGRTGKLYTSTLNVNIKH